MPVSALIAAAELFEISPGSLRVAVARLLSAGKIERDDRGSYRLGAEADPVDRHVRSWASREQLLRAWDGGWIGVQLSGHALRARGKSAQQIERALALRGFEHLTESLVLRPDNLQGGARVQETTLRELGLDGESLVFAVHDLAPEVDGRARRLWDVQALGLAYARSRERLERSEAEIARMDEGSAMVESFLLGGEVLRLLVLDPLLPEEIQPSQARARLVETMRRYDELGRRHWAAFMVRHGAPSLGAPNASRDASGLRETDDFEAPTDTRPGQPWSLQ